VSDSMDEGQLMAALRAAVEARAAVPAAFVEAGKNAYTWHDIDAELASLAYDSRHDAGQPAAVRSEDASVRALTFQSAQFAIEIEITDGAVFGQLIPSQPGVAEIQLRSGPVLAAPIDEFGCFTVSQVPDGPFRLRCRVAGQAELRTGWVTL
jgi:hypothetical protein